VTEMMAMTKPSANGDRSLPKRGGPRGLMPSTWLERTLRLEYVDSDGKGQKTSGKLLDIYPTGPILAIGGARTLLLWERLVLVELREG
jgi:hypothetical protein